MKFDVVFSIGPYCRPAYYLVLCNLRRKAYPLDWQGLSINDTLHLYENRFKDFFLEYEDLSDKVNHLDGLRYVVDTKNNIISMHHIKDSIPLDDAVEEFRNITLKRYYRLDNDLKKAKSILIVGNHNVKLEVLTNFLCRFSNIYNNKKIVLLNIHSRKNGRYKHVHKISDNLTICEYFFNDVNKDGDNYNLNKRAWIGNEDKWVEVLSKYYLE